VDANRKSAFIVTYVVKLPTSRPLDRVVVNLFWT
jgi:hypothetical protein